MKTLDHHVEMVVVESEDEVEDREMIRALNSRFKIAVCRLRSPNEVRTEPGIHAIISRHIKRDSLRNIIERLLTTGSAVQPTSRHIPYGHRAKSSHIRIVDIGKDEPLSILMAEDNLIVRGPLAGVLNR